MTANIVQAVAGRDIIPVQLAAVAMLVDYLRGMLRWGWLGRFRDDWLGWH